MYAEKNVLDHDTFLDGAEDLDELCVVFFGRDEPEKSRLWPFIGNRSL